MTLADFELLKKDKEIDEQQKQEQEKGRNKEEVRVRKDVQWNENVLNDVFQKIYSSKNFKKRYTEDNEGDNSKADAPNASKLQIQINDRDDEDFGDDEDDDRTVWNLLTVSLESNFHGEKFPLSIFKHLKEQNQKMFNKRFMTKRPDGDSSQKSRQYRHQWKIFVDAAAYVPSAPLDLSEYPIDFLAFSYSKVFGYPTGLGVLLIKKDIMTEMELEQRTMRPFYLRRNFFSGGTVLGAISQTDERHFWHTLPSYCYTHDSSYFSLSAFSSSPALLDYSPRPSHSPSPLNVSAPNVPPVRKDLAAIQAMKKERLRRREREREKERKARNYLSDLELDRQFEDGTIPYTSIIPLGFNYS